MWRNSAETLVPRNVYCSSLIMLYDTILYSTILYYTILYYTTIVTVI